MKHSFRRTLPVLLLTLVFLLFCAGCSFKSTAGSNSTTAASANGTLTVSYLDVGQGDSELIFLPNGDTILIDSGDTDTISTITQSLQSYGVQDIDVLIATHPHADHIGSMATVVRNFDIGTIYMPKVADSQVPTTVCYEKLLDAIEQKNLTIRTGKAGVTAYQKDGVTLEFLAPKGSSYTNLNNYSIVVKLTYGDTAFLFLGDAEQQSLSELTAAGYDLSCDVLKVGHHGSSNAISEKLLQQAQPRYGIISCGAGNSYGHPHTEALELLNEYQVEVYRTDQDGTIQAVSNGKTVTITKGYPSVA